MSESVGYREITLIGGSSHGKEYIFSDEFSVLMNKTLYPLPFDNDEIYTICQLKSGQWIGYISIEKELTPLSKSQVRRITKVKSDELREKKLG